MFQRFFLVLFIINVLNSCVSSRKHIFYGDKLYNKGEYKKAILWYEDYIKKNANNPEIVEKLRYKIVLSHIKLGNFYRAEKEINKILKFFPYSDKRDVYLLTKGLIYFEAKKYDKCIKYFNKIIKKIKDIKLKYQAIFYIALSYYKLNKIDSAIKRFFILSETENKFRDKSYFYLAHIFFYKKNDRINAYRFILKAIELKPEQKYKKLKQKIEWQYISTEKLTEERTISCIKVTEEDVWIGLWLGGVIRYIKGLNKFYLYTTKDSLISNFVRDIAIDKEKVFIATYNGVGIYNKIKGSFLKLKLPVKKVKVKAILVDNKKIWIGTLGEGVYLFNKETDIWRHFKKGKYLTDNYIIKIKKIGYIIWFCTIDNGLSFYDEAKKKWGRITVKEGLPGNTVKDIDGEKMVWFTCYNKGIGYINPENLEIKVIKKLGKKNNRIWLYGRYINIIRKRKNELWLGTMGDGIIVYDFLTKKIIHYTTLNGLPENYITAIEFDEDYVWIGTLESGLCVLYKPSI